MRPIGPDVPSSVAQILQEMQDAIYALQTPGNPTRIGRVTLKASLPPADKWPECGILCDEINSLVVSTLVAGSYAWKRADGSAV